MSEFSMGGESRQTPEERRREKIKNNVRKLEQGKETGEISEHDFGVEDIYYLQGEGLPITKSEVGNRAVVMTQDDLDSLGYIDLIFENGELATIDSEDNAYGPGELLIIFPEELGDIQGE